MRHHQVQAEWRRAHKALQAAVLLQHHGLTEDAISRAYYATMHAAKAALLVHDVMAESHAVIRRLFGQVLVVAEGVEREGAQVLACGHDQRGQRNTMWSSSWRQSPQHVWCRMRAGLWNAWPLI